MFYQTGMAGHSGKLSWWRPGLRNLVGKSLSLGCHGIARVACWVLGMEGGISRGKKGSACVIFSSKEDVGTGDARGSVLPAVACHCPMNESVLLLASARPLGYSRSWTRESKSDRLASYPRFAGRKYTSQDVSCVLR